MPPPVLLPQALPITETPVTQGGKASPRPPTVPTPNRLPRQGPGAGHGSAKEHSWLTPDQSSQEKP